MKIKPNARVIWDGKDGILKHGQMYLVWQVREAGTRQEFTLKYEGWQIVEPVVWHRAGKQFVFLLLEE